MNKFKAKQPLSESQHLGFICDNGDGTATYSRKKFRATNIARADAFFGIFGLCRKEIKLKS